MGICLTIEDVFCVIFGHTINVKNYTITSNLIQIIKIDLTNQTVNLNTSVNHVTYVYLYVPPFPIMDPFLISCIILIAGAIFVIYEAFSPGGFLLIPGIVLLVLGAIGLVWPDILLSIWAPVIALVVAIPVTLVTLKFYQYLAKPEPPTTTVTESLVGREGIVIVPTEAGSMKGKVKIGGDLWSATSDEPIEEGTEVIVESSEGVHVHVRRI